jgi:hypothetical protein
MQIFSNARVGIIYKGSGASYEVMSQESFSSRCFFDLGLFGHEPVNYIPVTKSRLTRRAHRWSLPLPGIAREGWPHQKLAKVRINDLC